MKGPAGILIINNMLPLDVQFKPGVHIDSAVFRQHMQKFAKKYPQQYTQKISRIANIGEKMTYYLGGNVGPKDLRVDKEKKNALIKSLERKLDGAKSNDAKRAILLKGLGDATDLVKKHAHKSNEMAQQIKSGSRGKPVQFARMSVGPIYAVDMNQLPKPMLIRNSFAEGLTSNEYFNVASQGRYSSVQASNATSEPGVLGKILVANADNQKITIMDCGTQNGLIMSIGDHHILGLYESGTNKLIDEAYVRQMKSSGKKSTRARTPITCVAKKGVCAKCYGLSSSGRLPAIGDNVGIKAAQTIGEILTQMTLSTKHSTMGKGDSNSLSGVSGFKTIINSPSSFAGAAVVSDVNGVVKNIMDAPQGGKYIFVGSKKYHSKPHSKLKVKEGDSVYKGQPLTDGVVTPKHITESRGIGEARVLESSMLHSLFKDSTGKDLQKKHFQLLARGHISLGQSKTGEIDDFNSLMGSYPRSKSSSIVGPAIKGKFLALDYGSISKGTEIDDQVIKELKKDNVFNVMITTEEPKVKPIFKSMEQKPSFSGNLFSKMNYRMVPKAIKESILYNNNNSVDHYGSDKASFTANIL